MTGQEKTSAAAHNRFDPNCALHEPYMGVKPGAFCIDCAFHGWDAQEERREERSGGCASVVLVGLAGLAIVGVMLAVIRYVSGLS